MSLAATLYDAASPATSRSGIVIVNSATGVRRHYYDAYAEYLAANGLHVLTYDYRGIGDSRPRSLRGFAASARQWGELDADGVIKWAVEHYPGEALLVVGHSIGGALLGLTGNAAYAHRVILVAPQSGYWRLFNGVRKFGWAFLWSVGMPFLTGLFGYFPAKRLGLGEDLPAGVAREFGAWCRDPEYIVGRQGVSHEDFSRLHAPVLAFSIEDDETAPKLAVDALLPLYVNAPIERRHVRPQDIGLKELGHFGFFRRSASTSLWPESLEWLKQA